MQMLKAMKIERILWYIGLKQNTCKFLSVWRGTGKGAGGGGTWEWGESETVGACSRLSDSRDSERQ